MSKIMTVANQKGGVGKTTTAVNLAASLAAIGRRVLLIDLDPQGNASMGVGIDKNAIPYTVGDVLLETIDIKKALFNAPEYKLDLLASNGELTFAEIDLLRQDARELRLQRVLEGIRAHYDFIVIDCPPALNMLTINAMVTAHDVIVPMQCEYYALEGLSSLLETIEQLRASVNPDLKLGGILRTMYDARNRLGLEVSAQLIEHFGDRVFRTVIPRNIRLAEAPSHGMPVLYYDKRSAGAQAYLALAGEVVRRQEQLISSTIERVSDDEPMSESI